MSDEKFLARWSRRKASAETPGASEQAPTEPNENAPESVAPPARGDAPAAPAAPSESSAIDPKNLPSIDSIGAATDVTVFLRAGVPAELARAALRRAWTVDPAIRDYIGLSENAWDFTAPHGVPGFGPLSAADAEHLLAEFGGRVKSLADKIHAADATARKISDSAQDNMKAGELPALAGSAQHPIERAAGDAQSHGEQYSDTDPVQSNFARPEIEVIAPQHIHTDTEAPAEPAHAARRRHGGALPK
jgi:hypothetical protein